MPTKRTSEEIVRIRPAFNSNGRIGAFEGIVRTGHEKTREVRVDLPKLKRIYTGAQCLNVANLVEYLATNGAGVREIGSGSIDLAGVSKGEFSMEDALSLQELYIGNPHRNITPLQWLTYLADGLSNLLPEQVRVFDEICGDLYLMATAAEITRDDLS